MPAAAQASLPDRLLVDGVIEPRSVRLSSSPVTARDEEDGTTGRYCERPH